MSIVIIELDCYLKNHEVPAEIWVFCVTLVIAIGGTPYSLRCYSTRPYIERANSFLKEDISGAQLHRYNVWYYFIRLLMSTSLGVLTSYTTSIWLRLISNIKIKNSRTLICTQFHGVNCIVAITCLFLPMPRNPFNNTRLNSQ